jgi:hypothetical protein
MLLQWCFRGIASSSSFDDRAAADVLLKAGLASAWLRCNAGLSLLNGVVNAHAVLSTIALDAHVNNFGVAGVNSPDISLTAGCVTADPVTGQTTVHSALDTAIGFATGAIWGGETHPGYVFKLWVIVTPKPAAELPGFGEEVRDLNQFQRSGLYHQEGEVAGKLIVPHRQIRYVEKYGKKGSVERVDWTILGLEQEDTRGCGKEFVPPDRVNNLRDLL